MDNALKETLWKQFGASIDMLENALTLCPDELWNTEAKFWYNAKVRLTCKCSTFFH